MLDLSTVKDWSIVVAGVIALVTFVTGALEYARRGRYDRAQSLVETRRRFLESRIFRECLPLLESDDPRLAELPVQERRAFLGFFEEVALMTDARLIKEEVASYMFGYYVGLAARSRHLWAGLDPNSRYWTLFRDFASRIDRHEQAARKRVLPGSV
jgi:hypothetical protein